MRSVLVAVFCVVACSGLAGGELSAQQACAPFASPAERAENALTRMVGATPIDSTRRVQSLALIEQAMRDTHLIKPATSAATTSLNATDIRTRLARMYVELERLLRPDIDLRHLARADAPPRYLTVLKVCAES